jgi:hypothetical protein
VKALDLSDAKVARLGIADLNHGLPSSWNEKTAAEVWCEVESRPIRPPVRCVAYPVKHRPERREGTSMAAVEPHP